jgi:hypothetical protein
MPAAESLLRHIPETHSSKQITAINSTGFKWVVNLLQKNWDIVVTFSFPSEFNTISKVCNAFEFHIDDHSES